MSNSVTPWTIQSMEFSRPEYWSEQPFLSPGDLPNPGIKPRSPAMQSDSLPDEPQGKPKNTGVGSLSLLQGIFLTQESNWGLLHCGQILHQLSYRGSPENVKTLEKPLLKMFIVLSNGRYVQIDFHKNLMTAKIYPSKKKKSFPFEWLPKIIFYCFILFFNINLLFY